MAVSRRAVLFLFLLLVAAEMGAIVDAKMGVVRQTLLKDKVDEEEKKEKREEGICLSKSLEFKGFCYDGNKCKEACLKEGFPGGECRRETIMPKCFCKKPC